MYEAYWGLQEKPFENTPDPRFLYLTDGGLETRSRAEYALQSGRGAVMLSGPSGCGKTLLARAMVQTLDPSRTEVALLTNPRWSPDEFLQEVLYQLGDEEPALSRPELMHRLNETLFANYSGGKQTIVLIDEGQLITDEGVLEELRLLLNFQLNDAFLVTLMLVGQPPMVRTVRAFAPLDERIGSRGSLQPLEPEQVAGYIAHRLQVAGRQDPLFDEDAVAAINEYAEGVPRRINNICDIALVVGYSRKLERLDADLIRRLVQVERADGG